MSKEIKELQRIRSILTYVTGFEDDDQEKIEDARKAVGRVIDSLAEQPAQKPPQNCGTGYCSCIECLFEQSVQQELVGYFSVNDYGRWEENEGEHGKPFYTEPPQRKPLTDEQIDAAIKAWFENEIVAGRQPFAKKMRAAIKAAYGIKENT